MSDEREKTERGFRVYGRSDDRRVQVVESSIAFEGPHVRIFVGKSEAVHLSLPDAKLVLVALSAFAREAEAGMLTEKVAADAPSLYGVVLSEADMAVISYALGIYSMAASKRGESDEKSRVVLELCSQISNRLTLARGGQ
jgi:hypothetical protein